MQNLITKQAILALLSVTGLSTLAGCAVGTSDVSTVGSTVAGTPIGGRVHGGQQPVVGATIQLYATGSTGYGSSAMPLLSPAPTTGVGGNFTVPGYTCPSPSAPVYLVATGGNSGSATSNSNLALMAALGRCDGLSAVTFVSINELTTVASVYALAPFMVGPTNAYTTIGTSANNALGLANAMADVNVLANFATGSVPGAAPAGVTVPVTEIDTLGNIIGACVNSGGGTYNDGSSCGTLFYNANPGGTSGSAPNDTITALMNIAQHPATSPANVNALFNLQSSSPPFGNTLSSAPNDFTLALTLAGGSLNKPSAVAADASGNMWVTNAGTNTVTELTHTGAALSGTGFTASLNTPSAVALASDGTVWITNQGNNTVSRLSSSGTPVSGSPYSGGGLNLPQSIAFDSLGTAWIANNGNGSVTTITGSGSSLTNYTPVAGSSSVAIAVNPH